MSIDWSNLYKLKVANSNPEFQKHEIVKLLVLMKLLHKYRKQRSFLRIYTEFPLEGGRKCDIYFEDLRGKAAYVYEIQKNVSKKWLEETKEFYKDWDVFLMRTSDLVVIPLDDLSDDINELNKQLDAYVM